MRESSKTWLAGFLLVSALCLHPAGAKSLYEDAMEKYRARLYQQAASSFGAAAAQEPANQLYHYLLANCLVHLDEHERAAEEYKVAYVLNPANSTGRMCKQALLAYKKELPAPGNTTSRNLHGAADAASSELEKVKDQIRQQADHEKDKHDLVASRSEQAIQSRVDERLKQIDQWMQYEIQKLSEPLLRNPWPHPNPLLSNPVLLKEKEDQIRAQASAEKERIKKEASGRSQLYEDWRKGKEALLDEAAGNLQTQLEQPAGRSGVKLQAHGTGLYVRYYGSGGKNVLPDPHQATVRIREAGTEGRENGLDGSSAAADAAEVPQAGESKVVKGRVYSEHGESRL